MLYTTLFTAVALIVFLGSSVLGLGGDAWLKMVTSTGFLAMAIAAGGLQSTYGRVVLVALFFSWWGDLFLTSNKEKLFLLGLVAFFLAHVAFAGAFVAHGVNWKWVAVTASAGIVPVVIVVMWLNPHLGSMRIPVYAYMTIISLMVALAAGTWGRGGTALILVGAVLFYLSDIFVARARFVSPGPWNGYIGLPLYYVAQMLLATSIARVNGPQG